MSPYWMILIIVVAALLCFAANMLPFLVLALPGRCSGADMLLAIVIAVGADILFGLGIHMVVRGEHG